jgi:hypothetical protein
MKCCECIPLTMRGWGLEGWELVVGGWGLGFGAYGLGFWGWG